MSSHLEPRRATVSCKHLSSDDRSILMPSSFRRHGSCSNTKQTYNKTNNAFIRSLNHSIKQQQKFIDRTNENYSNSTTFHVPFYVESTNDDEKKIKSKNTNEFFQISLNPLSPAFYSTHQTSLLSEQKQGNMTSR